MDGIKRFKILKKLGSGGMGDVFLAYDPVLDTKVALKSFKFTNNDEINANFYKRFIYEAQILAKLNHPNIVRIFDIGPDGKTPFISMEYVDGMTLKEFIYKRKTTDADKKRIVAEILEALIEVHKAGIVHRDIKPDNVMIDDKGHVRLMDFGIVKNLDTNMTQTNLIIGTPAYMSPEQVEGLAEIDGRSDLFSLASVIYEMFSKKRAFEARSQTGAIKKILMDDYRKFSKLDGSYGSAFHFFMMKAFEKNPENRFANAKEMLSEWNKIDLRHGVRLSNRRSLIFFIFSLLLFLSAFNAMRINRRKWYKLSLSKKGLYMHQFNKIKSSRKGFFSDNYKAYAEVSFKEYKEGIISGWALDFNNPDKSLNLFLVSGKRKLLSFKTEMENERFNEASEVTGKHHFRLKLPQEVINQDYQIQVEDPDNLRLYDVICVDKRGLDLDC